MTNLFSAYAQTNVQLYDQLRSEGYSKEDRLFVQRAYELGIRLFPCLFVPSGKPFIDHLVGTASILASLRAPVEVVAAGLIHALYVHGDFGSARVGASDAKQQQARQAVGQEVEEYVARYGRLPWNAKNIRTLHESFNGLDPIDRNVLLMRLANELEHQLDLGGMYYRHSEEAQENYQRGMEHYGPMLVSMAERLGFPSLAIEMTKALESTKVARVPLEPCIRGKQRIAYPVIPASYRERLAVSLGRKLTEIWRLSGRILHRAKRLYAKSSIPARKLAAKG